MCLWRDKHWWRWSRMWGRNSLFWRTGQVGSDGRRQGRRNEKRILKNWVSLEGNGNPLQYSCLENAMDGGPWWAAVHGVARSRTRLSDFTLTFHFHALEKEMATHSNVLTWRIPGTGKPGGLPSMELHRVGHNWSDLAASTATSLSALRRVALLSLLYGSSDQIDEG